MAIPQRRPVRSLFAPTLMASVLAVSISGLLFGQAPAPAPTPGAPAGQPAAAPGRGGGRIPPAPVDFSDTTGWKSMFDGRTLSGWDGNPQVWKIEDGAITADSTPERRIGTTYIIWQGGEPADFEWKFEVKTTSSVHSGFAYRSYITPLVARGGGAPAGTAGQPGVASAGAPAGTGGQAGAPAPAPAAGTAPAGGAGRAAQPPVAIASDNRWNLYGIGMDYDFPITLNGNVEERGTTRGEIAYRGGIVRTEVGKRPQYLAMFSDPETLGKVMNVEDWTKIHIIARGNQLTHIINGTLMTMLIDDDPTMAKTKGLIGLQVDGVGKIMFRNLWIKTY